MVGVIISLTALDVPILHSLHHRYYFHKGLRVDDSPASVVDPDHPIQEIGTFDFF